jgi:DNA-binding MarR family transcriptional regulator
MLTDSFEKLGLSAKEQRVFLALADSGKTTATTLSKLSGIPRATLYSILDKLIAKGVVSTERNRGTTSFLITSPSVFVRLVDEEKERLKEKEHAAKEIVTFLEPYLKSSHYNIPKVQLFEGKQHIESMLYDYLPVWRESYSRAGGYTLWGYQDHTFVEQYLRWHHYMWDTRDPREQICLFSNAADVGETIGQKIPRREVRVLPEGITFSSSIWIYGEYIVMGMTRQKPHYALQMKDPIFSSNLRSVFQMMWKARF